MLDDNFIVEVLNRSDGSAGYTIEDTGVHRTFTSGEIKKIPMGELRALSYMPGGDVLLRHFLQIRNREAIEELIGEVEPEYNYTSEDVMRIMTDGTMDQFLDMLDFAPEGVRDMIKSYAVKYELNDVRKREAIFQKYGFNVDNAIRNNRLEKEALEKEMKGENNEGKQTGRRAPIILDKTEVTQSNGRRTAPVVENKYKFFGVSSYLLY